MSDIWQLEAMWWDCSIRTITIITMYSFFVHSQVLRLQTAAASSLCKQLWFPHWLILHRVRLLSEPRHAVSSTHICRKYSITHCLYPGEEPVILLLLDTSTIKHIMKSSLIEFAQVTDVQIRKPLPFLLHFLFQRQLVQEH